MTKIRILVIALVSVLALGAVTTAVAKKKTTKVKTSISAKYVLGGSTDPYDPYSEAIFKGTVKSKKNKCAKKRKVVVKTKPLGVKVGSDLTAKNGKFKVNASGFNKGRYDVKVKKSTYKVKKKKGKKKKVICKPADATVRVK